MVASYFGFMKPVIKPVSEAKSNAQFIKDLKATRKADETEANIKESRRVKAMKERRITKEAENALAKANKEAKEAMEKEIREQLALEVKLIKELREAKDKIVSMDEAWNIASDSLFGSTYYPKSFVNEAPFYGDGFEVRAEFDEDLAREYVEHCKDIGIEVDEYFIGYSSYAHIIKLLSNMIIWTQKTEIELTNGLTSRYKGVYIVEDVKELVGEVVMSFRRLQLFIMNQQGLTVKERKLAKRLNEEVGKHLLYFVKRIANRAQLTFRSLHIVQGIHSRLNVLLAQFFRSVLKKGLPVHFPMEVLTAFRYDMIVGKVREVFDNMTHDGGSCLTLTYRFANKVSVFGPLTWLYYYLVGRYGESAIINLSMISERYTNSDLMNDSVNSLSAELKEIAHYDMSKGLDEFMSRAWGYRPVLPGYTYIEVDLSKGLDSFMSLAWRYARVLPGLMPPVMTVNYASYLCGALQFQINMTEHQWAHNIALSNKPVYDLNKHYLNGTLVDSKLIERKCL